MDTSGLATNLVNLRDMRDERPANNFSQLYLERFAGIGQFMRQATR